MSCSVLHACKWCIVVAALCALGIQLAPASNASLVSISYEVLQNSVLGSQAQIRMRFHLVNRGPYDLSIQRMTLWDFCHRDKGGTHICAITLHAPASAETTQEFTTRRPEYRCGKEDCSLDSSCRWGRAKEQSGGPTGLDFWPGGEVIMRSLPVASRYFVCGRWASK